jgi:hypothetical protein
MPSLAAWLPPLLLLASASQAQALDPGERSIWLGPHRLGSLPPALDAVHTGPPLRVGDQRLEARVERVEGRERILLVEASGDTLERLPSRKELMILTTTRIAGGSRLLTRYVDLREAEGFTVVVATERDWDQPTGASPDSRQARIRSFLQARYAHAPGAFLLLVGDPSPEGGDIPMQRFHPLQSIVRYYPDWLADELDPIPTDFWYAELGSSWDCDGDLRMGEYPDDMECMDAGPELFVGRLPVYGSSTSDLDTLLQRILDRDLEADKSHRRGVLLPAALYGLAGASNPGGGTYNGHDDGACIADAVHESLPDDWREVSWRLYEEDGIVMSPYEHDGRLDRDAVIARWQRDPGLLLWCGHGSFDGVYRVVWEGDFDADGLADDAELSWPTFMESGYAGELRGTLGAFTWHVSCDNGYPEISNNLGAELLYGGAAGTVTASRPSIGATSTFGEPWEARPDLATGADAGFYYVEKLLEGYTVGEALAWTRYALPGDAWASAWGRDQGGYAWLTRFEFNLYGDPTRSLERCVEDADCDDGSACDGAERCLDGFCVHGGMVDCAALNGPCVVGACDDATGACAPISAMDGADCDDGLFCTQDDACEAGACQGVERSCGEKEGYAFWCSEDQDLCLWEELGEDPPPSGEGAEGCACAASRLEGWRALPGLLLGLLLVGARRYRPSVIAPPSIRP